MLEVFSLTISLPQRVFIFHHAVLKRKRRNRIVAIKYVNDNILHDLDDIATEFVN
jgi:hypothetical protein